MSSIVLVAIACTFFLLSYVVWAKKLLLVIAGVPQSTPNKSEQQMARDGGILSLIAGLLTFVLVLFKDSLWCHILYGSCIFLLCLFFVMRAMQNEA